MSALYPFTAFRAVNAIGLVYADYHCQQFFEGVLLFWLPAAQGRFGFVIRCCRSASANSLPLLLFLCFISFPSGTFKVDEAALTSV
jgi:hypothetical protein